MQIRKQNIWHVTHIIGLHKQPKIKRPTCGFQESGQDVIFYK